MGESKKVALIIMDGWGEGEKKNNNAIFMAKTPFIDSLYKNSPYCYLTTFGEAVGLPEGQMGNSEVGHINIGAGRVVYQELARINKSIANDELKKNNAIKSSFEHAKKNNSALHFFGLLSSGGVHSHIDHLIALCKEASDYGLTKVFVHCFMDGRDTDPRAGLQYIQQLQKAIENTSVKIASVVGRYYAMDRDNRWERIKIAYDLLTKGIGAKYQDLESAMKDSYQNGVTDEFILPIIKCDEENNPIAQIKNKDAVICFNFRTDRCRQITSALTQKEFPDFRMNTLDLHYTTFTRYDESFKNVNVVYENENLKNTLGEVLEGSKKKQLRIAETEKYPHVTFFFSGGREKVFEGESRIVIPSPKVATYDLQPEMSAIEVRDATIKQIQQGHLDFICLNFANPDMVGHTGVFDAIVKAVETVDSCVEKVVEAAMANGYSVIITADHGNADFAVNPDGSANTAHSMNPVPCFLIEKDPTHKIIDGRLGDLAPTILTLMGINIPKEMRGNSLIV
ncbi:MAG: 2,3-bisphosphoglycerate-independent phosphoglycerate mutase [Bacteroidia bacterium]|nr:2,3-bisphosphoglycerate-independent phosphoglycerate mutase [Bacteroidia bacterium]